MSDQPVSPVAAEMQLLQGSQRFFPALVADIDAAQSHVWLETYIFDITEGGALVALALERAARRGVTTQVLVDGVGSQALNAEWQQRMLGAGVQWRVFAPLGRMGMLSPRNWRRLHRKLVCIDQRIAYCGGINILDDFYDPNHGKLDKPRFDFSVRVTGAVVADVSAAMAQLWQRTAFGQAVRSAQIGRAYHAAVGVAKVGLNAVSQFRQPLAPSALKTTLVLRDNVRHRAGIEKAYRKAISHAQSEVIIANAYFVPGRKLRLSLIHAAKRGVKVQLLLQGKYEYFMQYYAARPVYGALLKAGVEIHEYSASFLHAKVAVVDGNWATVGSSNLDPLSLLLAREANITVQGKPFAAQLRTCLLNAIAHDGEAMAPREYGERPWAQRAKEYAAFIAMRLALMLQGRKYL